MTVDMGAAKVGDDDTGWLDVLEVPVTRAVHVDMGNPHLVLLAASAADVATADLVHLGVHANQRIDGGVNVELVASGSGDAELLMQVYERGVGITEACGTGAVAAAVAAHAWHLAPPVVTVRQPGGDVQVAMDEANGTVELTVPVVHVATIDWLGEVSS
jgi:diaminopimelate epimerase